VISPQRREGRKERRTTFHHRDTESTENVFFCREIPAKKRCSASGGGPSVVCVFCVHPATSRERRRRRGIIHDTLCCKFFINCFRSRIKHFSNCRKASTLTGCPYTSIAFYALLIWFQHRFGLVFLVHQVINIAVRIITKTFGNGATNLTRFFYYPSILNHFSLP